ncbi:AAA family ATPase [Enterobacter hormaechei]|uniref:AAA family ATPase n=1 Tax=Enterobacter hormaechei TaxID=158836 RepID=UPI000907E3AF|nr:AAA family ATPase [Enterobacter hormaechei]
MFVIPKADGSNFELELVPGEIVFLLGPNGSGKSSIIDYLYKQYPDRFEKIIAHRQNWIQSNRSNVSNHQSYQTQNYIKSWDSQEESRYKDDYSGSRTEILLNKIISAENHAARTFRADFSVTSREERSDLNIMETPIEKINRCLGQAFINIKIRIDETDSLLVSRNGSEEYSLAQLSDGERNAIFIAISIFTSPDGACFLIDEPERHLHPSISHSLIKSLLNERADCSYIISTHDLSLPSVVSNSKILLLRDCVYRNMRPSSWLLDAIDSLAEIDERLREDILGSRKKIIFVEGNSSSSLDQKLYSIIFPDYSIVPKSSCDYVERSVDGLRESESLHHVIPYGIIDNDNKPERQVSNLETKGVYSLNVHSIESIYYHPDIVLSVINNYKDSQNISDPQALYGQLCDESLSILSENKERLCCRAIEKAIRSTLFSHLPTLRSIEEGSDVNININVAEFLREEVVFFESCLNERDLASLIARYPIRETAYISKVHKMLGYSSRQLYEHNLLRLVAANSAVKDTVKGLIGNICNVI